MRTEFRAMAAVAGCCCMLVAVALINVSVARGGYRLVLVEALAFVAAANACFVVASWRGGRRWIAAAVVASLPTVWVVSDVVRRLHL